MNRVVIGVVDERIALFRTTIGGGKAYRPLIRRIFTRIQRIGGIGKPIDENFISRLSSLPDFLNSILR